MSARVPASSETVHTPKPRGKFDAKSTKNDQHLQIRKRRMSTSPSWSIIGLPTLPHRCAQGFPECCMICCVCRTRAKLVEHNRDRATHTQLETMLNSAELAKGPTWRWSGQTRSKSSQVGDVLPELVEGASKLAGHHVSETPCEHRSEGGDSPRLHTNSSATPPDPTARTLAWSRDGSMAAAGQPKVRPNNASAGKWRKLGE